MTRMSQADIGRNAIGLEAGQPSSMTKRASTCRSSSLKLACAPTADSRHIKTYSRYRKIVGLDRAKKLNNTVIVARMQINLLWM